MILQGLRPYFLIFRRKFLKYKIMKFGESFFPFVSLNRSFREVPKSERNLVGLSSYSNIFQQRFGFTRGWTGTWWAAARTTSTDVPVNSSTDVTFVESNHLNTGMCKSESSQSHESRVQWADSSKACSRLRAVNWLFNVRTKSISTAKHRLEKLADDARAHKQPNTVLGVRAK